ncbi:MAG: hypothetical protein R3F56_11785 [Planctomycetota bacterium]
MTEPRDPYPTTLWTKMVHRAIASDPGHRDAGWRRFLQSYREPIEHTLRARLRAHHLRARSDQLVDEFFSYLAAAEVLARADRARGPFRRFIQGVARNFVFDLVRKEPNAAGIAVDAALVTEIGREDTDAEDAEELGWFRGLVHTALHALAQRNPRQAHALARRFGIPHCGGRAGEEAAAAVIADELDTSTHAVHELLRRGKRELRNTVRRRLAETLRAGDGSSYHADYVEESACMERRARELWPDLWQEDASEAPASPGDERLLEERGA